MKIVVERKDGSTFELVDVEPTQLRSTIEVHSPGDARRWSDSFRVDYIRFDAGTYYYRERR